MSLYKKDIQNNKTYLKIILLISVLTLLPQLLTSNGLTHFINSLLLIIFLISLSTLNKFLFSIFTIYINLINIFQSHIVLHWGEYTGDLFPRIDVAMDSPLYETFEYLRDHVDYRDYIVVVYTFITLSLLFFIKGKHQFKHLQKLSLFLVVAIFLTLFKKEPLQVIQDFYQSTQIHNITSKRDNYLASQKFKKTTAKFYDKIIFIQGESANKNHLSIYGYNRPTTPFLSQLKEKKNLSIFNAIAPANQTRFAVPMLLTSAHVSNWLDSYIHSPSLLSEFKNAGFTTYWISNQSKRGIYDNYVSNVAKEANRTIFLPEEKTTKIDTDQAIINYLKQQPLDVSQEFYLLHLVGSHGKYQNRYLEKDALFKKAENIIDIYDNTIYFTDKIIQQTLQYFEQKNLKILLIYISDHSDMINLQKHGHGFSPSYQEEYQIPFVIYSNVTNPRITEILKENQKKVFNSETTNSIVKYISYLSDDINISYSSNVLVLDPKSIYNYEDLDHY